MTLRQLCHLQESCDCPSKLWCDFRKGHSSFLVLQTMCFGYISHLFQITFFNSKCNTILVRPHFQKLLKCLLTLSPKLQEWLFGHIRTFINCRSTINEMSFTILKGLCRCTRWLALFKIWDFLPHAGSRCHLEIKEICFFFQKFWNIYFVHISWVDKSDNSHIQSKWLQIEQPCMLLIHAVDLD